MALRRFEFVGGTSAKFWEVGQSGPEVTVRFGRLGTNGQTQTKDLGSEAAAELHVYKLIGEKLGKGYVEVNGPGFAGPPGQAVKPLGFTRPPVLPPYEVPPMPAAGRADIGGVLLPAGRRLEGDPAMAPPGIEMITAPVAWLTDAVVADAGAQLYRLRAPASQMGLVPVLLSGMESDPARPWDSKEFSPTDPRRTDHFDAAQELAHAWQQCFEEDDEESLVPVEPFGLEFPGLANPPDVQPPSGFGRLFARVADPTDDRAALAALTSKRIGLVAANRPADVITALGWCGAVNVHQDPALMSAVLRSWEDRWAARLVEIGFDTLTLTVGNPPRDRETALALAAEHFALCPDNVWQGVGTLMAYAKSLIGARMWTFWWD
jgi:predicted DNA-binding WGR domain protein